MTTEARLRALEAKLDERTRQLRVAIDNLRAVGSTPRFRSDADMRGNRVVNISDAVNDTDAINKRAHEDVRGRSFICVSDEPNLPAERRWIDGTGIDSVDTGPNGTFTVSVDTTELGGLGYPSALGHARI